MFLLVEDLLHLAVLQIVQLTHCILGPLDEVEENAWRTFSAHKIMLDRQRERRKWSEVVQKVGIIDSCLEVVYSFVVLEFPITEQTVTL